MALFVYEHGITIEAATGKMKKYLKRVRSCAGEDIDRTKLRVYGDKVYIYKTVENGNLLITVIQIPKQVTLPAGA
jgi:transposase-like protein